MFLIFDILLSMSHLIKTEKATARSANKEIKPIIIKNTNIKNILTFI